ncbi:monovalent cation/H+ antiporter subunit D family protein [soil metagenome]
MEIYSTKPLLAILASFLGAILIVITGKKPNLREGCSIAAGLVQLVIVLSMIPAVQGGAAFHFTLSAFIPQVSIGFRVDALALIFAATASFLWIVTTIYSIGYMRGHGEANQTRFYASMALTLTATMGIAFSANLFTLYLFYEALTFSTYPLITHTGTEAAYAAGKKYIAYHLGTSIAFLLPAIIITYTLSGTFDFRPGGVFPPAVKPIVLFILYFLFVAGAAKAALIPFHAWLPAAMVAPVPVSALLHAVAVVNAGVFLIFRVIFDVFGQELFHQLSLGIVTAVIASITIMLASFYALRLDNLKALLAYSTIGQLGYMILGVSLPNQFGETGGIIHIVNHSFSKITLFFAAGSILLAAQKTEISQMSGIGRFLPWTMGAFTVGALSIIGIPPTAGFVTKYYLAIGSIQSGWLAVFFVLLVSTLLSAAYYLRVVRTVFFGAPAAHGDATAARGGDASHPIGEVSPFIVAPMCLTAALAIVLGLFPTPVITLIRQVFQ